jgi:hypothetical protein
MTRSQGAQMKCKITRTALLILSLAAIQIKSSLASEPIAIKISAQPIAKSGSDVVINVLLTNISDKDVNVPQRLSDSDAELNYSVKVVDETGQQVASTEYGTRMKGDRVLVPSRTVETLQPNASATAEKFLLNRLFALTPGHSYIVQVKRQFPYDSGIWVRSNSIKITLIAN